MQVAWRNTLAFLYPGLPIPVLQIAVEMQVNMLFGQISQEIRAQTDRAARHYGVELSV